MRIIKKKLANLCCESKQISRRLGIPFKELHMYSNTHSFQQPIIQNLHTLKIDMPFVIDILIDLFLFLE